MIIDATKILFAGEYRLLLTDRENSAAPICLLDKRTMKRLNEEWGEQNV